MNIAVTFLLAPTINTLQRASNVFLNTLKSTLSKIKNRNKHITLSGDFNCNLLKYEYIDPVGEFLNIMFSNFLQLCINEPTRIVTRK